MNNSDCIFCKIVKGELPCYKIYEDDNFLAFLDIQPVNKGHAIIITKQHFKDLLDIPEKILCEMIKVIQKISKAVITAVDAKGFNIGINNGKVAGQAFFHIHVHIMPRFEGDGHKLWPGKKPENYDKFPELTTRIKNSL